MRKLAEDFTRTISFCLLLFTGALALSACAAVNGANYSYEVGLELGQSGEIGRMYAYGQSETAREACNLILEVSLGGTPADDIDWGAIVKEDFIEGCLEGTRQAHPGADWIE